MKLTLEQGKESYIAFLVRAAMIVLDDDENTFKVQLIFCQTSEKALPDRKGGDITVKGLISGDFPVREKGKNKKLRRLLDLDEFSKRVFIKNGFYVATEDADILILRSHEDYSAPK